MLRQQPWPNAFPHTGLPHKRPLSHRLAQATAPPPVVSGVDILDEGDSNMLPTGCPVLDSALRGGLPLGISELCGEASSGKTQLLLQLALTAQLPTCLGGAGGRALFLSTEGPAPTSRLRQMAEALERACRAEAARIIAEVPLAAEPAPVVAGPATGSATTTGDASPVAMGPAVSTSQPKQSQQTPTSSSSSASDSTPAPATPTAPEPAHISAARARLGACLSVSAAGLTGGVLLRQVRTVSELEGAVSGDVTRALTTHNRRIGSDADIGGGRVGMSGDASSDRIAVIIIDSITAPYRYDDADTAANAPVDSHAADSVAASRVASPSHTPSRIATPPFLGTPLMGTPPMGTPPVGLGSSSPPLSESPGRSPRSPTPAAAAGGGQRGHFRRAASLQSVAARLRLLSRQYGVHVVVSNQVGDLFTDPRAASGASADAGPVGLGEQEVWEPAHHSCRLAVTRAALAPTVAATAAAITAATSAVGKSHAHAQNQGQDQAPAPALAAAAAAAAFMQARTSTPLALLTRLPPPSSPALPCAACASAGSSRFRTGALGPARVVVAALGGSWGAEVVARVALSRGVSARAGTGADERGRGHRACKGGGVCKGQRPWECDASAVEDASKASRALEVIFAPHAPSRVRVPFAITAEGVRGLPRQ